MQKDLAIFSGIKPSGELHLGNYLGAFQNFLKLQDEYKCFFSIVDLHSLTQPFTQKEKQKQILEMATDFLALGLDPNRSTLFIQSHLHEHAELTWIFNCLTSYAELQRMTQFKDKSIHDPKNINVGLFDYPVLQAADILLYKPAGVPVGKDQEQHLELTRMLARTFNKKFGNTFPIIKSIPSEIPKVMSLTRPEHKMSKSDGPKSYIALQDEPAVIKKKLKKAVTGDVHSPGSQNLLLLLKHFAPDAHADFSKQKEISFKNLKETLGDAIADHFQEYREKKKELLNKPDEVRSVFNIGAEKARIIASSTMNEVKEKVGLI